MEEFNTGDTIRLVGTFRDWAESPDVGALIDPDTVEVTIYDNSLEIIVDSATATQDSTGIYYYDWITPTIKGYYTVEFLGMDGVYPIVDRDKIALRFVT